METDQMTPAPEQIAKRVLELSEKLHPYCGFVELMQGREEIVKAAPELARVCLEMARELESAKRFLETMRAPTSPTEAALLVVKGDGIIRGIEAVLASFRVIPPSSQTSAAPPS